MPTRAVFAAEYAITDGIPRSDAMEAVKMMFPCFRFSMEGSTTLVSAWAALT